MAEVRIEMEKEGADLLVLTALDEVAWMLNLRGNDIPYNPGKICKIRAWCGSGCIHVMIVLWKSR